MNLRGWREGAAVRCRLCSLEDVDSVPSIHMRSQLPLHLQAPSPIHTVKNENVLLKSKVIANIKITATYWLACKIKHSIKTYERNQGAITKRKQGLCNSLELQVNEVELGQVAHGICQTHMCTESPCCGSVWKRA